MDGVDRGLASPALATHFAGNSSAMFRDGVGEFLGQIKIAAYAFVVGTTESEHGLGVGEVDGVLDLAVLGDTFGIIEAEVHGQSLQLTESVSEARRVLDPLAFLFTVF